MEKCLGIPKIERVPCGYVDNFSRVHRFLIDWPIKIRYLDMLELQWKFAWQIIDAAGMVQHHQ